MGACVLFGEWDARTWMPEGQMMCSAFVAIAIQVLTRVVFCIHVAICVVCCSFCSACVLYLHIFVILREFL